jgi:hypothetical protein
MKAQKNAVSAGRYVHERKEQRQMKAQKDAVISAAMALEGVRETVWVVARMVLVLVWQMRQKRCERLLKADNIVSRAS